MIYDNKEIYEIYKNISDILIESQRLTKLSINHNNLISIVKNVLGKLYIISLKLSMINVYNEIDKVKGVLYNQTSINDKNILMNCLLKCKKCLEANLQNRSSIIIFSRNIENFAEIINYLQKEGYNVLVDSHENRVFDYIVFINPDIVIIDNDFTYGGYKLYKTAVDEDILRNIPVIFTGLSDNELKINTLLIGALDYIERPFLNEEVIIKIRNIIQLSQCNKRKSIYDMSIGICSKKYGQETSEKAFKECYEKNNQFSVLLLSIDNIAQINITMGKNAGTQIIKNCTQIFKKYLESKNIIYRHDKDEFVMIFQDKAPSEVLEFAKAIQNETIYLTEKYNINFTCGIACSNSNTKCFNDVLNLAGECVKKGKSDGKGIIYVSPSYLQNTNKKNILFIDDDKIILSILSMRYSNKGYQVYCATNGQEAVDIFKNNNVDLVVTDFFMPGMSGNEVIKAIREINSKINILVLSSQKSEVYVDMALKAGANDYICKPFSPVELDLRIERFLNLR